VKNGHYEPGDKVYVRHDLTKDKYYDDIRAHSSMSKFKGKIVTILDWHVQSIGKKRNCYHIVEDRGRWPWRDAMFAGLNCGIEIEADDDKEFLDFVSTFLTIHK